MFHSMKGNMSDDTSVGYAPGPPDGPTCATRSVRGADAPQAHALPLPGATMSQAIERCFRQYATFTGRASRSEYWWTVLFLSLVWLVPTVLFGPGLVIAGVVASQREPGFNDASRLLNAALIVVGLLVVVTVVPSLAILWRRLHDAGFPGALCLLSMIPLIGCIIVFVLLLMPSKSAGRRFDRTP